MGKLLLRTLVVVATLFTAGVAFADRTHVVTGTVVSIDTAAHTLTLKGADGKTNIAPVEGVALTELKGLQTGEQVAATCRDNDKGEHQAVNDIKIMRKTAYKY